MAKKSQSVNENLDLTMTQEIQVTSPDKRNSLRPSDGFAAWQATIGYIATYHSPDAVLKLRAYPNQSEGVFWAASVSWGNHQEKVDDAASLPMALTQLWQEVDRYHTIFLYPEHAVKKPEGYTETDWLDVNTQDILHRLIWTTHSALKVDWQIVVVYQPTEVSNMRVQVRLLANGALGCVGGRGPSLLEAARDIFRNAVPLFVSHANAAQDDSE